MKFFRLLFQGFCIGIANIIPGVSGGTIAFLFGIYEQLIESIKSIDLKFLKLLMSFRFRQAAQHISLSFFAPILAGALLAIAGFSKLVIWLSRDYTVYLYAFFFGLILMSVPLILKSLKKWNAVNAAVLILFSALSYQCVSMMPAQTPDALWFIFLCGAAAVVTMILPGISGSFVLLLLGKYEFILNAVNSKDIVVLGVFMLGMIAGILSFVRVLSFLFKRLPDLTIAALTGVVIGSLYKIWPWKHVIESFVNAKGKTVILKQANFIPAALTPEVFYACLCILAGLIAAYALAKK